ncbi:Zinc finger MYND domain-containing protein 17 [Temnothorax longispinosus]|uniref:Zinc finger MYND domain-containing protein 17 n=1 Tax=Temnothorax longispinosus TaxID=300112 RepID=A0A4S2KB74_9HYME|nr:Zinc finger MYND domain-containing protein 17 [Temnothorax longispinosus]
MKDFVNALGNIQTDSEMPYDFLAAEYSQYLTRANYAEETTFLPWRVLPQLMETVMSVVVIMTGPGLKDKFDPSRACNNCLLLENKSLFFEYHNVSYENYVRSPSFVKPDLIVRFNLSIEEHELESNKKISASSIHAVAKQNCPSVLTFFTLRDFEEGTNKMNAIMDKEVDYLYSGKNPFASFRPH